VHKVSELCSVDFDLLSSYAAVRIVLVYIMQDQKCRMPPVTTSANPQLVSSSSEDPSSFDNETGCMKGIFQLFDRHHSFSSRRYGSKRITTENGNHTHTVSAGIFLFCFGLTVRMFKQNSLAYIL
jgi:hypothetical protein